MNKNATYKDKFTLLQPLMLAIVQGVKKELKNEHLKKDWNFVKRYFPSKNVNKLSIEEMADGYYNAIAYGDQGEEIGEFISHRWVLNHAELYNFFEEELSKITSDFSQLTEISHPIAKEIMDRAIAGYGSQKTYLFCVLNSVVFPEAIYQELRQLVEQLQQEEESKQEKAKIDLSKEEEQINYEQQMARMNDKYEKRIQGLQKKYTKDIDALKKQIAQLQRKMALHV